MQIWHKWQMFWGLLISLLIWNCRYKSQSISCYLQFKMAILSSSASWARKSNIIHRTSYIVLRPFSKKRKNHIFSPTQICTYQKKVLSLHLIVLSSRVIHGIFTGYSRVIHPLLSWNVEENNIGEKEFLHYWKVRWPHFVGQG